MSRSFVVHAGARAAAHVRERGLRPSDITCVPAAAGGPKGLGLIPLDKWLFGTWLRAAPQLELIGASIGAWRMFAAAQRDAVAALNRLTEGYLAQRFPPRPPTAVVAAECRRFVRHVMNGTSLATLRADAALSLLTTRARGGLATATSRAAFARAAGANALARARLARHMERVIFAAGAAAFPKASFDPFGLTRIALNDVNFEDALLASGSIPIVCDPVAAPAGSPPGLYWDGGLIDYHLVLPYAQLHGLVLYPHFLPYLTAGWLDKFLPWRKRARAQAWLANVILIAPSGAFLRRLPQGRLPDRKDFLRYGTDDARRVRDWRRAIAECERFADEAARWLERPDPSIVLPL